MFALALCASALWLRERHSVAHAAYGRVSSIEFHDQVARARKALTTVSVASRAP